MSVDSTPDFYPQNFTVVGSTAFFIPNNGSGLWKTDGTAVGTVLVKDLGFVQGLVNVGGVLFFRADDGTHGSELWKSDGTAPGTVMIKDIGLAAADGPTSALFNHNGVAYFNAGNGASAGLWKSDGTEAGTVLVKSVGAGFMMSSGVTLYFQGDDGASGQELWKTDGTEAGTQMVADLASGIAGSTPFPLFTKDGSFYFSAVLLNKRGIYVTNGTGASLVTESVNPSGCEHYVNGVFYFSGFSATAGGVGLWKTDGTSLGTVLVKDFNPNSSDQFFYGPTTCLLIGTTLYMSVNDGTNGSEPWKSDGTTAGTVMVKNINTFINSNGFGFSSPAQFAAIGSTLYFTAHDGNTDGLWKSDGSTAGTVLVSEIRPGGGANIGPLTALGSQLLFSANDGIHGQELWKSNGTSSGTVLVKDLARQEGSVPGRTVYANGLAFFAANDGVAGVELWKSDGSTAGTARVRDIAVGAAGSSPEWLTSFGNAVYFSADDGLSGRELWKTDGTEVGTVKVREINDGAASATPKNLTVVGNVMFFSAADVIAGGELWKTDGTEAGTVRVKDLVAGSGSGMPVNDQHWFFVLGSRLMFATFTQGVQGLWRSDGTDAGTVQLDPLAYFAPNTSGGAVANGFLYYASQDLGQGTAIELFKTNGVTKTLVKKINDFGSSSHSFPGEFFAMEGIVYFLAHSGSGGAGLNTGRELWKTNGSPEGTVQVADINPGPDSAGIANITGLDGKLYFTATDGEHSHKSLWVSDGTLAGTQLLKDIPVSEIIALPSAGRVLLSARAPDQGQELWETDGTDAGTVLLQDIQTGAGSSAPAGFSLAGPWLLFSADDGTVGREPWLFDLGAGVAQGPAGPVTATPDAGSVENFMAVVTPSTAPTTHIYPYGFYQFEVTGLIPGATVNVTMQFPAGSSPTAYIKCNVTSCTPFSGASFSGNAVTLTLVDGGAGDADGIANGTISDPGAPALITTGGGGGGGGSGATSGGGGGGGPFPLGLSMALLAMAGLRMRSNLVSKKNRPWRQ